MPIKRLDDHIVYQRLGALAAAATFEDALLALEAAVQAIGFERFILVNRVGISEVRHVFHNAPAEWKDAAEDLDRIRRDPVIDLAGAGPIPLTWSRGTYVNAGAAALWDQQAAHGYRSGLCVSSGPPDAQISILVAATEETLPNQGPELTRAKADLALIVAYAYSAVEQLLPANLQLRPREVQCLEWVLKGKTSWETAKVLGISERTVNQHLARAMTQLGVNKKQMAAIRAVQLGLLPRALLNY